ncbi:MAG: hypothetical protein R3323_00780, partial [Wenzhouxiangellaceae bacterium]|nr:hypothetical protein [Wenzhouxiangellaceae bacterium]
MNDDRIEVAGSTASPAEGSGSTLIRPDPSSPGREREPKRAGFLVAYGATLTENLRSLFIMIAVAGSGILGWVLLAEWQGINERHEIRQRSQIATLASATRSVLVSQEMVLALLGRQLLGSDAAPRDADRLVDRMFDSNDSVAAYAAIRPDGTVRFARSEPAGADLAPLLEPLAGAVAATSRNARVDSNGHEVLSIDRPQWLDGLDEWVLPVREVIQGSDGRPIGTMVAALRLEGDRSFFEPQSFLGPRNNVQIVRDADLVPI